MAGDRLSTVLKLFSPEYIVVTKERWDRAETNANLRSVEMTMMRVARTRSIPICCIKRPRRPPLVVMHSKVVSCLHVI